MSSIFHLIVDVCVLNKCKIQDSNANKLLACAQTVRRNTVCAQANKLYTMPLINKKISIYFDLAFIEKCFQSV